MSCGRKDCLDPNCQHATLCGCPICRPEHWGIGQVLTHVGNLCIQRESLYHTAQQHGDWTNIRSHGIALLSMLKVVENVCTRVGPWASAESERVQTSLRTNPEKGEDDHA